MNLFLLCLSLLIVSAITAPPPSNIGCIFSACKCTRNSDQSFDILCVANDSETLFPIRRGNDTTEDIVINTFLIKRYKFKTIPDEAFAGLAVRNLIIGENALEKLTANAFRSIKSLGLLRIIEKNFNAIEPNAFASIRDTLTELGLWQLDFKSAQIDAFFEQLATLERVKTLNLMGYYLTEFKSEWTKVFANLTSLSLVSNDIKRLNPSIFNNAKHLQSLDFSNNFLTNLSNVFEALKPVQNKLRELKLYANSIEQLSDFPELPSLQTLDLSNNKIKAVYGTSFKNLPKLTNLYISNNLLNKIEPDSFDHVGQLYILLLNNNYLTQTPSIACLGRLKILDLSNQNGHMRALGDYAFERRADVNITHALSVNLDLNEIERFGDKAFCNRNSRLNEISNVDLAYSTARRIDWCMYSQLTSTLAPRVSLNIGLYKLHSVLQPDASIASGGHVVKNETNSSSSNEVCNCGFKMFIRQFKVDLIGGCSLLVKSCGDEATQTSQSNATVSVATADAVSICKEKSQFQC